MLAVPLGLIVIVSVGDILAPPKYTSAHSWPLLPRSPHRSQGLGPPPASGPVAVLAQAVVAMVRTSLTDLKHSFQLTTLVLISVFVTLLAHRRERHEKELTQLRSVAEAAQQVVLRPLPRRIGPLRIASVYLAAEAEAQIGGDLFAAARAGQGTRFIVGDVRGKGLEAIGDAALLNCGHPPPLLLHKGQVTSLEVSDPAPPLGLEEFAAAPSAAETFPSSPVSARWPSVWAPFPKTMPRGSCVIYRKTSSPTRREVIWATTPPWWRSNAD
ncbi:hypothetical protein [Streptomyces sp. N502]|uniref:hypothetical protein n=1 Tax=Streptomyces sp. N502 TaxID=2730916 RepID=UPI003211D977